MKLESLEKRIDKYLKATEQDLQIDDIIVQYQTKQVSPNRSPSMMDLSRRARKMEITSNSLLFNDQSEQTLSPNNNIQVHLKKKKSMVRRDSKA